MKDIIIGNNKRNKQDSCKMIERRSKVAREECKKFAKFARGSEKGSFQANSEISLRRIYNYIIKNEKGIRANIYYYNYVTEEDLSRYLLGTKSRGSSGGLQVHGFQELQKELQS
jgi:hypothetical protein